MKILILSSSPESYSTKRLVEECKNKRIGYEVIDPYDLYAFISSTTKGHDRIYKRTEEFSERLKSKDFDAILPRVAGANFDFSCHIIKQLTKNMHTFSTGYEPGLKICSNKFLTSQVLSAAKIRNPKQIIAHRPGDWKELIDIVGGLPTVAKLQRGSMGEGIMILTDYLSASTSLSSFQSLGADVILQQFIDSGDPKCDIRVVVIGPETKEPKLFAYMRFAVSGEFRSNYSLSGIGTKVELTDEERQMAIDAALACELGVSGVDILRSVNEDNKPYILEVNGSPGLKGVETVTGENIASSIIEYIKDNYKKKEKNVVTSEKLISEPVSATEAVKFIKKYRTVFNHLRLGGDVKLLSHIYRNQKSTVITKQKTVKGYP